jgi:uncharacterized protein YjiS (DUF1127 family)
MSAHTANFQLPSLSYIDAKWEEPNLRAQPVASRTTRKTGLAAWLSHQVAAFIMWRRDSIAAAELASMSDHELMDIGISRSDLSRVFDPSLNQDLRARGTNG